MPALCGTSFAYRFAVALLLMAPGPVLRAQATPPDQMKVPSPADTPDSQIVEGPVRPKTPEELKEQAWTMLSAAVTETKHGQTQVQALAALGSMGVNSRSLKLIHDATLDRDVDVRTASILADGQTKSPTVTTDLRQMLDDKEPQVAFTAALTLWKMHDRSGEDVLVAVASGGRSASAGLLSGTQHDIHKQLQNPAGLARYGAMQGAAMLLGPFGMGITAYEYLHKNGGDSARVSAIEAIAQNHTEPIRKELLADLADKDLGVRAAAVRALARYHDPAVAEAIARLFLDAKAPVRFTAAASYLVNTGVAPGSPDPEQPDRPARVATKKR